VKASFLTLSILLLLSNYAQWNNSFSSQLRLGVHSGISAFRGDLGSYNLGMPYLSSVNDLPVGADLGAGGFLHLQINNHLFLRLNCLFSRIQGIRDEEWTNNKYGGPITFRSTINDFDLTFGFHVLEVLGIHDLFAYRHFTDKLEVSLFGSAGIGTGKPETFTNNQLHSASSYSSTFTDLGSEFAFMVSENLSLSVGSRLRVYHSDAIDGYVSGTRFDALWYHSVGLVLGFGSQSSYKRRF
jgi:hypothetical protein